MYFAPFRINYTARGAICRGEFDGGEIKRLENPRFSRRWRNALFDCVYTKTFQTVKGKIKQKNRASPPMAILQSSGVKEGAQHSDNSVYENFANVNRKFEKK